MDRSQDRPSIARGANIGAVGDQGPLQSFHGQLFGPHPETSGQRRSRPRRLTHRHARGGESRRAVGFVARGDRPADDNDVLQIFRQQRAERDPVRLIVFGARRVNGVAIGAMNIEGIRAAGDVVVKLPDGEDVLAGERYSPTMRRVSLRPTHTPVLTMRASANPGTFSFRKRMSWTTCLRDSTSARVRSWGSVRRS